MSQSLSDVLLHFVFSTKDRHPYIHKEIQEELYRYISGICRHHQSPVIQIGGIADHVHILVAFGRNVSISKFVSDLKANSSKWIKTKDEKCKYFAWQGGYGAFSLARRDIDTVIRYIASQEKRHEKISFQEEYLSMLRRAEIPFDEQYLWD